MVLGRAFQAYAGYNASEDPRIDALFATTAFRYIDSAIPSLIPCVEADGTQCSSGPLLLRDVFSHPSSYLSYATIAHSLRGLATEPESAVDTRMVPDLRNHLDGVTGNDQAVIDIMRGRDFGMPSYTQMKMELGLAPAANFSQLTGDDSELTAILSDLYHNNISTLDAYVGGLVECGLRTATSSLPTGSAFRTIVRSQFLRLRSGDWYYYANPLLRNSTGGPYLPAADMEMISTATIASIIARVTGWSNPPDALFKVVTPADILAGGTAAGSSSGGSSTGGGGGTSANTAATSRRITISSSPLISLEWIPPANTATTNVITLTFTVKATGYFSFGIGSNMVNSDCWLMRIVNGAGDIVDGWCSGYTAPPADPSQDLTLVSASVASGTSTYIVRRAVTTSDAKDKPFTAGSNTIMVAWHATSTNFIYHEGYKVGTVDFLTPLSTSNSSGNSSSGLGDGGTSGFGSFDAEESSRAAKVAAYGFHALTMAFEWSVLVPACVYAVRSYRHVPAAYAFHKWGTVTALTLTLPAAGTALVQASTGLGYAHAQLGLATATLLVVEVMLGALTRNYLRGDKQPPQYWRYVRHSHRILGWLMTLASAGNCVLGVQILFGVTTAYACLAYFAVLTLVFMVSSVVFDRLRESVSQPSVKKLDEDNARRFAMSHSATSMTIGEVRENVRAGCQWLLIGGYIYDVGPFIKNHPGGAYLLERNLGQDVSALFFGREAYDASVPAHAHSQLALTLLRKMCVAALKQSESVASWADAPPMPEANCIEEWTLTSRIVVPGDPHRPVVKLEFSHVAAEATPALSWAPSSFGRCMVVMVPSAAVRAVLHSDPFQEPVKTKSRFASLRRMLGILSGHKRLHPHTGERRRSLGSAHDHWNGRSMHHGGGSFRGDRFDASGRWPMHISPTSPDNDGYGFVQVEDGRPYVPGPYSSSGASIEAWKAASQHLQQHQQQQRHYRTSFEDPAYDDDHDRTGAPSGGRRRSESMPGHVPYPRSDKWLDQAGPDGRNEHDQWHHHQAGRGRHDTIPEENSEDRSGSTTPGGIQPGSLTGHLPLSATLTPFELVRLRRNSQEASTKQDLNRQQSHDASLHHNFHGQQVHPDRDSHHRIEHIRSPSSPPVGQRRASFGPANSNAELSFDPLEHEARLHGRIRDSDPHSYSSASSENRSQSRSDQPSGCRSDDRDRDDYDSARQSADDDRYASDGNGTRADSFNGGHHHGRDRNRRGYAADPYSRGDRGRSSSSSSSSRRDSSGSGQSSAIVRKTVSGSKDHAVERPYTIVRGSDKPGLVMYVRRYPMGALSRYLYTLTPGQRVTMAGPRPGDRRARTFTTAEAGHKKQHRASEAGRLG